MVEVFEDFLLWVGDGSGGECGVLEGAIADSVVEGGDVDFELGGLAVGGDGFSVRMIVSHFKFPFNK